MKTLKKYLLLIFLVTGLSMITYGQGSNEWNMVLNNDNSAFTIAFINHELNFTFRSNDTLSFSTGNKKAIKSGFGIEITLKNNGKVVYTSGQKNLNKEKNEIIILMSEVKDALKNIKLPSKPKYVISIKDKNLVKEKILFEIAEK